MTPSDSESEIDGRNAVPSGQYRNLLPFLLLMLVSPFLFAEPAYRNSVTLSADTAAPMNLFWNENPVVRLHFENKHAEAVPPLRYEVHAVEMYYNREAWAVRDAFRDIPPNAKIDREETIAVPCGVYRIKWILADQQGEITSGALDVARMTLPCYRDVPEEIRAYDRRWAIFGGAFGSCPPELASDMGVRWIRCDDATWDRYEKDPGSFDMQPLSNALTRWNDAGSECIILQPVDRHPKFQAPLKPGFARAYGVAMKNAAEAAKGLAAAFELGSEEDGPTKMLYAEVARHGAAAVRSAQPAALVANGGTKHIDLAWLQLQADRKLFDLLDVLCTHPYTEDESPEAWKLYEKFGAVDGLIDQLGGMKLQWATEFGWPMDFSPQRRAEWIPRHLIIAAAGGVEREGLCAYDGDYGIFHPTAQPAAASVHALAKMLEGSRFAGLLSHDDNLWIAVFERAGRPLAVGFSPAGNALWPIDVAERFAVLDLYGATLPAEAAGGKASVHVTGAPVYVVNAADSVLAEASANQCRLERERFMKCLNAMEGGASSEPWAALAANAGADGNDLRNALVSWKPQAKPIPLKEQAVIAQALRWHSIAARLIDPPTPPQDVTSHRRQLEKRLAESVAEDADIPSLRYLLNRWQRLADEESVARASKADKIASRLRAMQETVATVSEHFAENGIREHYSLWPNLYTLTKEGDLQETLRFAPGRTTSVTLRISSYSRNDRDASVSLSMPNGWTCEPAIAQLSVKAGQTAETQLQIVCPSTPATEHPKFRALLRCDGLPERETIFDDVSVEAKK